MQVNAFMTQPVDTLPPDATVQEAAQRMRTLDVGFLPTCDGERVVGLVTDRDIAIRAAADDRPARQTHLREIMTPEIIYCYEDQDAEDAARLMSDRQVRRLLVLNRRKRLVGVVSLGDLAVDTKDDRLSGRVLERVSEPSHPRRTTIDG